MSLENLLAFVGSMAEQVEFLQCEGVTRNRVANACRRIYAFLKAEATMHLTLKSLIERVGEIREEDGEKPVKLTESKILSYCTHQETPGPDGRVMFVPLISKGAKDMLKALGEREALVQSRGKKTVYLQTLDSEQWGNSYGLVVTAKRQGILTLGKLRLVCKEADATPQAQETRNQLVNHLIETFEGFYLAADKAEAEALRARPMEEAEAEAYEAYEAYEVKAAAEAK